jgi:hypothetical protein
MLRLPPMEKSRRYLPTFAELVDRLSIAQLKAIYIPQHRDAYRSEIADLLHDIDLIAPQLDARAIHAAQILQLANRVIWENESAARAGAPGSETRLRFTHSINGVRATAKNVLSQATGERCDYKVDCLAADLPQEFGDWRVFDPPAPSLAIAAE